MNENKDYIIVGAGLGGLFCGAILAHYGKKVSLIEAHYNIGGYASSFKRKKSRHEVAIHVLDNLREGSFRKHWFDQLKITENIEFVPIPEYYDIYIGSQYFKVPATLDDYIAYLIEKFPHEESGLMSYKEMIAKIQLELDSFLFLDNAFGNLRAPAMTSMLDRSLKDYFDEIFTDPILIEVIIGNIDYFHDDYRKIKASSFLFSEAAYLSKGQSFIKGSSQSIGDYLKKYIEERGGKFFLGHLVQEVLLEQDQVIAVKALKRSTGDIVEFKAEQFVFNNSPVVVANWLQEKSAKVSSGQVLSPSACSLYLDFKKPPSEFGVKAYMNAIFLSGKEKSLMNGIERLGFVDYSHIDSGLSETSYLGSILYLDQYEGWSHLSKDEYDEKKNKQIAILTDIVEKRFPGLMSACERIDFATPLTMERYTHNPKGAVYAFSNGVEGSSIRTTNYDFKSIKNIHFASAWVIGPGFNLCSSSGLKTGLDLLDLDYFHAK